MVRFIGIRLAQLIPVLLGVTFFSFSLVNLLPGNVAYAIAGGSASPAQIKAIEISLHLNQPIPVRYLHWLWSALHGDLGYSMLSHQPVTKVILTAAPPSIEMVAIAQIVAITLGVIVAIAAVLSPWAWLDRVISSVALVAYSMPSFVTGIIAILVLSVHLHLLSSVSYVPPSQGGWWRNVSGMFLPGAVLGFSVFPSYMRILRREMMEQLENEEYVVLARIKGVSQLRIMLKHVARNSALGVITLIGLSTGLLLGGAVIIDQVFTIPGLGSLLLIAIQNRDATVLLGLLLVVGTAIVLCNLAADVCYALADPRIRSTR